MEKKLNRQITWENKFGPVLTAQGITAFPSVLLSEGAREKLDMSQGELLYAITLFSFCWDKLLLFPSHVTIAGRMGLKVDAVRGYHRQMVRKGLITSTARRGGTNIIGLQPLIKKLESLCCDDKKVAAEGVKGITGVCEPHDRGSVTDITPPCQEHDTDIDNDTDNGSKKVVCAKHTTSPSDNNKNTSRKNNKQISSSTYVHYAEDFFNQYISCYQKYIGKFPFRNRPGQLQLILKAFQKYDVPPAEYKGFVEDFFQSEDSYIRKSDFGLRVFVGQIPRLYAISKRKTISGRKGKYDGLIETYKV